MKPWPPQVAAGAITNNEGRMKAKITSKEGYRCAPEGHTVVRFGFGEIVTGKVAEWALADGAAKRMFERKKKDAGAAPENKAE